MTEKLQITIIGLGLIGASAGLALRRYRDKITVTGHDRTPETGAMARKIGAVDRTEWNLINAVAKADRVLLALPAGEIRETLSVIAGDLKKGCVLLDTAEVKEPVMQWAAELLSDNVHFVGGHPIILSEEGSAGEPRADLFENRLFCLTADPHTSDAAVQLAADMAHALGAHPFFLDAKEHDGMVAGVEHLPVVAAAALMAVLFDSPSWRDSRKLAASQFYSSTLIANADPRATAAGLIANRENLMHWLDQLVAELEEWRRRMADGDADKLAAALSEGARQRDHWVSALAQGNWDEDLPEIEMPSARSMWRNMLGFRRPTPGKTKPAAR